MRAELDIERQDAGISFQEIVDAQDWDSMFCDVEGFTEAEIIDTFGATFDELACRVAEGPSDEAAVTAIRSLVSEVQSRGYVEQALQMAMTLGAMGCTHSHMQGLASEVNESLFAPEKYGSKDNHHDHEDESSHNAEECKDCKKGKPCRKK